METPPPGRPSRGQYADDRTRGGNGRADRGEGSGVRGPGPKAWLTWVVLSHLSEARGEERAPGRPNRCILSFWDWTDLAMDGQIADLRLDSLSG